MATLGIALAIFILVLGHVPGRADQTPLSISISGNHFVNGSGQTIWLLGDPHAAVAEIKDHVAFYPDRVDAIDEQP